jgi:hypothetical protein
MVRANASFAIPVIAALDGRASECSGVATCNRRGVAGICSRSLRPHADAPGRKQALSMDRGGRLRSAVLALLIAVLAWPSFGAEAVKADVSAAAAVLERFIGSQGEAAAWPVETIEIQASLPTLKQTGRLRAIRRLLPVGLDYKVLEIAGDATVKNQVIVRYISADEKATELAAASVAPTPANYKIHYAGTVWLGNRLTYAFRMIPRKKREGLINGVLWLDSETGIPVRESGYLAKSPSVFVKRINLTRENEFHNGAIAERVTHLSVEARLVGRAQLIIVERPTSDEAAATGVAEGGL